MMNSVRLILSILFFDVSDEFDLMLKFYYTSVLFFYNCFEVFFLDRL
jgi:hypothetical protein